MYSKYNNIYFLPLSVSGYQQYETTLDYSDIFVRTQVHTLLLA